MKTPNIYAGQVLVAGYFCVMVLFPTTGGWLVERPATQAEPAQRYTLSAYGEALVPV